MPRDIDYLLFFIGIPVSLGVIFSLVGTRLTYGMPYLDALVYMILHMFIAWWSVNLGAAIVKLSFRSWRPPAIVVCLMGVFIALIPAAFMFQLIGDYYASLYPVFAANRYDTVQPNWDLAYLVHFIRYSSPVLPTFLAGVFGYRAMTGVDWFGYPNPEGETATERTEPLQEEPVAKLIEGSALPPDALLIAIKAEQHYIRIWSNQGKDFVRYRFRDLGEQLRNCKGTQVHRSWWINPDFVLSHSNAGRKLELLMDDGLKVPVSQSYKHAVLTLLDKH